MNSETYVYIMCMYYWYHCIVTIVFNHVNICFNLFFLQPLLTANGRPGFTAMARDPTCWKSLAGDSDIGVVHSASSRLNADAGELGELSELICIGCAKAQHGDVPVVCR